MVRKLRFPIKLKLILSLTGVVLFATAIYLYIALDLYKKDKSAYIYDSTLNIATNLSSQLNDFFNQQYRDLQFLKETYHKKHLNTAKYFFAKSTSLVEFSVYTQEGKQLYQISSEKNHPNKLPHVLKKENKNQTLHYLPSNSTTPGYILLSHHQDNLSKIYLGKISLLSILKLFNTDSAYQSALINLKGNLLAHTDLNRNTIGTSWIQKEAIKRILTSPTPKGVIKEHFNKKIALVAYSKIKALNLCVISYISEEKSFVVIEALIKKSIFVGIFIASIAIILSIFMARFLTSPLEKLVDGTFKIAKGNFRETISISSNDEIGLLADSFNYMSQEILHFTEEMKEKIRMENELNIAKLVQSSFFPPEEIELKYGHLSSFYCPASECGGDWWGFLKPKTDLLILMIGDATGHGVPAALSTATVNCCANNLKVFAEIDPSIYQSSARMLTFFNQALTKNSGNILMTFFIAVIDFNKKVIQYSNAGHNPPLLCNYNHPPSKKNLFPLKGANSLRLGIDDNAKYFENEIPFDNNSYLILYSDGLVEGTKNKQPRWGKRLLYKTIIEGSALDKNMMKNRILQNALDPSAKNYEFEDDLTLVTLSLIPPSKNIRQQNIETIIRDDLNHYICPSQPDCTFESELLKTSALSINSFFDKSEILSKTIQHSSEILPTVDHLLNKISPNLNHPSYHRILRVIATELLSNAIYNAPTNELNEKKYSEQDRKQAIPLNANERVKFEVASNKKYAAISVVDSFGSLTKEQLTHSIRRGFIDKTHLEKAGGAGLGLFMVYSYANKIIIEKKASKTLRFTAIIHNFNQYKKYKETNTSFHFSEKKPL